jgi:hypothetical protein
VPVLAAVVGDPRQVASVRRIVLDDGPETGVRALAFSTGGGLDFWVLSDRSLDIGPLWWKGTQLGWQAPGGFRSPALTNLEGDQGRGFDRSFSGFLVTCGLDHTRQPDEQHPLHGRLPFTPARVTAYGEDWQAAMPVLYVEGEVIQARLGGEALRLRRRIESPIGGATITIRDTVENIGADASPQAMLYHFNLGYPAIGSRTTVALNGRQVLGPMELPTREPLAAPFNISVGSVKRPDVAVVTSSQDGAELTTWIDFDSQTLPFLQFWHDLSPRNGVFAVEPCTSARLDDGQSSAEMPLEPGESRHYELAIRFSGYAAALPMR